MCHCHLILPLLQFLTLFLPFLALFCIILPPFRPSSPLPPPMLAYLLQWMITVAFMNALACLTVASIGGTLILQLGC